MRKKKKKIKRIAKITEKIVPFMAGIYIIAALIIIATNIGDVPLKKTQQTYFLNSRSSSDFSEDFFFMCFTT